MRISRVIVFLPPIANQPAPKAKKMVGEFLSTSLIFLPFPKKALRVPDGAISVQYSAEFAPIGDQTSVEARTDPGVAIWTRSSSTIKPLISRRHISLLRTLSILFPFFNPYL